MQATYEYGPRGDMPALKLTWYQGANKPPQWTSGEIPKWDSGVLFVGDKGMLLSDYGRRLLLPQKQFVDFKAPEPFIPNSIGHHREWIEAIKTGGATTSNFDYAGALTEAVMLGLARKVREHSEQRQILGINNPLQRVCAQVLVLVRRTSGVDLESAPGELVVHVGTAAVPARVRPLGEGRRIGGHTLWAVADVTRDRERQENIFQELQHAIDYLDHAPAGFFSVDANGEIGYLNATLAAWLDHREVGWAADLIPTLTNKETSQ